MQESKENLLIKILLILIIIGLIIFLILSKVTGKKEKSSKKEGNITINEVTDEVNEDTKNETKDYYAVLGVDGKFKKIEEIALFQKDIDMYGINEINIEYDMDNDGKKDLISFSELKNDTEVSLIYNNSEIDKITYGIPMKKIYIVDLDKKDNYLEFLIYYNRYDGDVGDYILYKYEGENYKKMEANIPAYLGNLYISEDGKIASSYGVYESNPLIVTTYYDNVKNDFSMVDYSLNSDTLINFKNVQFTQDLQNAEKVNSVLQGEELENWTKVKEEYGIVYYNEIQAYLFDIVEDSLENSGYLKVKLKDGTIGYFITTIGI